MELVPSRQCQHADWFATQGTSIEFCKSCGLALLNSADPGVENIYAKSQVQPRPGDTFQPVQPSLLGIKAYRYLPLDLENGRYIRVLVLKAGWPDEPLCCALEHVNLQQDPVYEALSYTWADESGDDSLCRSIQCGDDGLIAITKNCEAALRSLRKRDIHRRLWVDAVCINQSDVLERSHQVKNMIAIFRAALRVVVFIGEGNVKTNRLVEYISRDSGGELPKLWDIVSLFQCRWFHRIWVLQEVAVAKDIVVIYGPMQMTWADMVEHGNLFLKLMAARRHLAPPPPMLSYGLLQKSMPGHRTTRLDLLSLLQISRNCSCKDPRDKVYAITGLLRDERTLPLQADYSPSTTAAWVFLQVAAWQITTSKSLEILLHAEGISAMGAL
ncbi:Heterokaryon incompatibility domain-containing protein [Madurella fahalii]|uniref:Heterokaryon incompatibility domain-containing protein n=1 Tax=Madurella fahalii TaxID=1157608 RepID=A0ABQ0G1Z7_9PEZI